MSDPLDLTASILQRTSGSACGRLHGLAWDFLAGGLDAGISELAEGHLQHCAACRARLARLEAARRLLPGFANLDPGEAFTSAVLARTRTAPVLPRRPRDPLLEGWARLMRRPRAALEAAYLATAAGFIFIQVPLPGLHPPHRPAFMSLVQQESRRPAVGLRQAWTARVQAPAALHSAGRAWSRLSLRVRQARLDLAQAIRAFRARLWRSQPTPPPAEPSDAPRRPAP